MLSGMDSAAPLAAWVALGGALVSLTVVAVLGARARPRTTAPRDAAPPDAAAPDTDPARPAARRWAQDDLPSFLEAPPGTPRPLPPARPAPPDTGGAADEGPVVPAVAGLAAAALALVAALAVVALLTGHAGEPAAAPAPAAPAPAAPALPAPTARPPDLPPVPSDPLPGERGAGQLAARSVPLGDDGVSARLGLGGLVLERRAVGVTVTYPAVSATVGGDGTALAHLRLPTWNCLGTAAPEDPQAAGCTATGTEYADLPTPALGVTREGDALRLAGRFPTYTRPAGTPPVYTGRVYDLSVTVAPRAPLRDGEAPAEGALFLGTERAVALPDPALSRVRVAG
jgi:hypothetical protein